MSAKHTPGKLKVLAAERGFILTAKDGIYDVAVVRNIGNEDNAANAARLALCWNTHDQLMEALVEAVESGMVPVSSAADGGASSYSRIVRAADQIRAAIKAAKGEA